MADHEKVKKAIMDVTKQLIDQGLNGEEYLLVLQTLVAHVLVANDLRVKKIWLMNLNSDIRIRRMQKMKSLS